MATGNDQADGDDGGLQSALPISVTYAGSRDAPFPNSQVRTRGPQVVRLFPHVVHIGWSNVQRERLPRNVFAAPADGSNRGELCLPRRRARRSRQLPDRVNRENEGLHRPALTPRRRPATRLTRPNTTAENDCAAAAISTSASSVAPQPGRGSGRGPAACRPPRGLRFSQHRQRQRVWRCRQAR